MVTAMNAPPLKAGKPRYGTMKIRIGSNHVVSGPDGIKRQFQTRDISRFASKAKYVCVCFRCNKQWENEAALLMDHPENRILEKQEEEHVYGFWSLVYTDFTEPKKGETIDYTRIIGLMSDEE